MERSLLAVSIVLLVAVIYRVHSTEAIQETDMNSVDAINRVSEHVAQKRSVSNEDALIASEDNLNESPYTDDFLNKRGTLFRFGKRGGSLFRFGKRQGGTLFRFGKRGGTLLRFGRGGSSDDDKRVLFRYGKESDLDLLREALAEYEFQNRPVYLENPESKRGIDSFHWGSEAEK